MSNLVMKSLAADPTNADDTSGPTYRGEPTLTLRGRLRVDAANLGPGGTLAQPTSSRNVVANAVAQAAAAGATMRYFSFCEVQGLAAEFKLYVGAAATPANELARVKMAAGESDTRALSIDATTGIYVGWVAGKFDLTIIP